MFALYLELLGMSAVCGVGTLVCSRKGAFHSQFRGMRGSASATPDTLDNFTFTRFHPSLVLSQMDVLPLGTDTVQTMFTVGTSIEAS
jgi:hypothetical protein